MWQPAQPFCFHFNKKYAEMKPSQIPLHSSSENSNPDDIKQNKKEE